MVPEAVRNLVGGADVQSCGSDPVWKITHTFHPLGRRGQERSNHIDTMAKKNSSSRKKKPNRSMRKKLRPNAAGIDLGSSVH